MQRMTEPTVEELLNDQIARLLRAYDVRQRCKAQVEGAGVARA